MTHIIGGAWISPEAALRLRAPAPQGDERDASAADSIYACDMQRGAGHLPTPGVALQASGGAQLGRNEDGSVRVLFDGALYNDALLRRRLEGSGHRFRASTSAETLAHLYEDEGRECFHLLEGPFAIAIWEAPRRRMVLARDALGQRPLHYMTDGRRITFGSGLRDLLEAGVGPREVDFGALDEYLTYGYVPHAHALLRGYHKLPPGFVAVYQDGDLTFARHWNPDFSRESQDSPIATTAQVGELLKAAVAEQTAGGVAFGVWFTGDVETTILAALAHEATGNEVPAYYLIEPAGARGAADGMRDELKPLGAALQTLTCEIKPADLLPAVAQRLDEPLADIGLWRALCLGQQTPEQTLLTGEGANALFAGLPRHRAALALRDVLPRWTRWLTHRPSLDEALESSPSQRRPLSKERQAAYFGKVTLFDEAARSEIYTEHLVQQLVADPSDFLTAAFGRIRGRDPVAAAGAVDLLTCLPCSTLPGLDAMLDVGRQPGRPFLNRHLVELAIAAPGGWNAPRRGVGKLLLRRAFRETSRASRRLPRRNISPVARWLREDLREMAKDILLDPATLARGFFQERAVTGLLDAHQAGQAGLNREVWALLVLETWLRRWVDGSA